MDKFNKRKWNKIIQKAFADNEFEGGVNLYDYFCVSVNNCKEDCPVYNCQIKWNRDFVIKKLESNGFNMDKYKEGK